MRPSTLRASFVRVRGERDRVYVRRSGGGEVSWVFPTYGDELPHDLVHLVAEAAFGLREGFWGCVDAGADPARINADANRAGAGERAGFGDGRRGVLLAEALANARWWDHDWPDRERVAEIARACADAGIALPAVTEARAAEVRAVLDELRARWRAFGDKGTITVELDPAAPEASFAAMLTRAR